ncbi:MAG: transcriptional repressor [Lachnospiraceae bacterium]|nr:transcriptional repressor [Lachnospiraceae bacterium]
MNSLNSYHTKQQQAILGYMENNKNGYVTVSQIATHLKEQGTPVGITTIYRHLDKFQKEGVVQKIVLDGNSGACYQYIHGSFSQNNCQFLLKCENCGKITNMGCSHMQDLYSHVLEEHNFNVNPHRTMFYGTCSKCLHNK